MSDFLNTDTGHIPPSYDTSNGSKTAVRTPSQRELLISELFQQRHQSLPATYAEFTTFKASLEHLSDNRLKELFKPVGDVHQLAKEPKPSSHPTVIHTPTAAEAYASLNTTITISDAINNGLDALEAINRKATNPRSSSAIESTKKFLESIKTVLDTLTNVNDSSIRKRGDQLFGLLMCIQSQDFPGEDFSDVRRIRNELLQSLRTMGFTQENGNAAIKSLMRHQPEFAFLQKNLDALNPSITTSAMTEHNTLTTESLYTSGRAFLQDLFSGSIMGDAIRHGVEDDPKALKAKEFLIFAKEALDQLDKSSRSDAITLKQQLHGLLMCITPVDSLFTPQDASSIRDLRNELLKRTEAAGITGQQGSNGLKSLFSNDKPFLDYLRNRFPPFQL